MKVAFEQLESITARSVPNFPRVNPGEGEVVILTYTTNPHWQDEEPEFFVVVCEDCFPKDGSWEEVKDRFGMGTFVLDPQKSILSHPQGLGVYRYVLRPRCESDWRMSTDGLLASESRRKFARKFQSSLPDDFFDCKTTKVAIVKGSRFETERRTVWVWNYRTLEHTYELEVMQKGGRPVSAVVFRTARAELWRDGKPESLVGEKQRVDQSEQPRRVKQTDEMHAVLKEQWRWQSELHDAFHWQSGALPKHEIAYKDLYRKYRATGMRKGPAKRAALEERSRLDSSAPIWELYWEYAQNPDGFILYRKEKIEELKGIYERLKAEAMAVALARWRNEDLPAFLKKWEGAVSSTKHKVDE